jgi:N-acylglucosamine-6-phosphate 2-epimerase
MIKRLADNLTIPLIAEGGIWEIKDFEQIIKENVHAVVIGSAITRPKEITERFVKAIT